MQGHPAYRPDIDGLRAVAVLAVVGFHAFPEWVPGGFTGVDVFFVISGFLISSIIIGDLQRGAFSFAGFYARRIRRIFPALLLVLAACLVAGRLWLLPDDFGRLGRHVAGGAGFIANVLLWGEAGYFDDAADAKPLLHLWSLGIEEQFYIAWPLLLWLAWRLRANLPAVTAVLALASFAMNVWQVERDPVAAFYLPHTRIWELLAGAVLAQWPRAGGRAVAISMAGALLVAAGIALLSKAGTYPGWAALLPVAGAVLLISAGPDAAINRVVLSNRMLVWFGLISYPLYLWHWPLLVFLRLESPSAPTVAARLAAVVAAVLLAWITWRLIERPARAGRGATTAVLAVGMFAAAAAGYACFLKDGFYSSYPELVQQLARYRYDGNRSADFGDCFLTEKQGASALAQCAPGSRSSLVLWGDSHARQFYPGYAASFGGASVVVRATSGCPPILDMDIADRPHCRAVNAAIMASIEQARPATVVLSARWVTYDWRRIAETVARLRRAGVVNIELVGPVPEWELGLPRQMYRTLRSAGDGPPPQRLSSGLVERPLRTDAEMAELARGLGLRYRSPVQVLCDGSGCLAMLGTGADTLTAWDYGHLTVAGSRHVAAAFAREFSPAAGTPSTAAERAAPSPGR